MMKEIIKCPYCGNEVYKDKFCSECGHMFSDEDILITPKDRPNNRPVNLDIIVEDEKPNTNNISPEDEGFSLIVESYNATVATVDGDYYEEYCLYQKDDLYEIHHFIKHYNRPEFHEAFKTNVECKNELYDYIEKNNLINYIGNNFPSPTGGISVIKYKKGNDMIRISNDNIAYQNYFIFVEFRSILLKYIDKNNQRF